MRVAMRILMVGFSLMALLVSVACEDRIKLGEVLPVVGLDQDWDADGTWESLPSDPGEGDYLVDFGQVVVLQRATRVIALANTPEARANLHWTSITLEEGSSPNFFLEEPPVNDILPGERTYFTINYIPSAEAVDQGRIVVETNDPENPLLVLTLAGEGVSPDVQVCLIDGNNELCNEALAPSNLSVDFGMNELGQSTSQQVLVRNVGVHALTVAGSGGQGGVDFGTATSHEFALDPDPWSGSLAAGEQKVFTITYSPFDGGADDGQLVVRSDDPDEPQVVVDLLGNGLAPKICPVPPFLVDFGSIQIGSTSEKVYTFTSCGNQVLSIDELSIDSGLHGFFSFTTSTTTPFDLSPGESFDIELTYAPTAEGAHSGQVFISSNDPNAGEGWIDLLGIATPVPTCDVQVYPTALDFGAVSTSGFSNQTVTIANTGDANCDISEIRGPTGSAEFSFPTSPFVGAIPPGEARQFSVRYQPADEGADTATITVVCSTDPDEGETVVTLTGQGVQPPPCDLQVSPALLNFGSVPVGGRVELTTTVHNFGSQECFVTDWSLTAGSSPDFHPSGMPFPFPELAPGETLDIVVAFEPSSGGLQTAEMVVSGSENNPFFGLPMATVSLTGGGEPAQMCIHPPILDFGPLAVGQSSVMEFRITACGPGNLRLRQISFDGANPDFTFATVPGAPRTIPAGSYLDVSVQYSPSAAGADFGRVLVSSNDDDQPNGVVELVGNHFDNCPAVFDCQPSALIFPQTELGRSADLAFICTNHGTEALTASAVSLEAGTSPEFLVSSPGLPRSIGPGEQLHVEVGYVPVDVGVDVGAVRVTSQFSSNECDNYTVIAVPLDAEGIAADLPPCIAPQQFQPELIFEWPRAVPGNVSSPTFNQVFMTPIVINLTDDDGDGFINENDVPDIIFNAWEGGLGISEPAIIRAISGDDGHEIFAIADPRFRTNYETQIAAADIDGDNLPEILASKLVVTDSGEVTGKFITGNILCFEHDGTFKWESEAWHAPEDDIEDGSAIGIADLDHDGHPEIFRGPAVFDYRGNLLWEGQAGRGSIWHGVFCTAADLDEAGEMELVCGNTAYRHDGTIFWQANKGDGLAAVADFNLDGLPEVLLFAGGFNGGLVILNGQTGAVLSTLSDNEVNAVLVPVIADIDGSGGPEIGVVGTCQENDEDTECFWGVDVNESNLGMNVIWKDFLNDSTLGGGNSAFDFEGDGPFEVLQNDETYVNIFSGLAHTKIYEAERYSVTGWENPLVVDVNNDDHAEIVVIENGLLMGRGILVYGNAGPEKWVATKKVWNQYDYHITNIRENGTIPRFEVRNWEVYNNFLANEPFCE